MTRGRQIVLAAGAIAAAVAACVLNPQPLPPGDDDPSRATNGPDDASARDSSFQDPEHPPPSPLDGGAGGLDGEGGVDAGDAGDAGATDASDSG